MIANCRRWLVGLAAVPGWHAARPNPSLGLGDELGFAVGCFGALEWHVGKSWLGPGVELDSACSVAARGIESGWPSYPEPDQA